MKTDQIDPFSSDGSVKTEQKSFIVLIPGEAVSVNEAGAAVVVDVGLGHKVEAGERETEEASENQAVGHALWWRRRYAQAFQSRT